MTTVDVWEDLKKEGLKVSTKDDSQMSRLWKSKKVEETGHPRPARMEKLQEKTVILERPPKSRIQERNVERRKPEDLGSVTQHMKELRLSQVEAQKRLDEKMLFMRDVFTKSVSAIPQLMYVAPNQYGNREHPPPQGRYKTNLKGCYWDRKPHVRDNCEEL